MSKTETIDLEPIIEAYNAWEEATRCRMERGGVVIPVAYPDAPHHVAALVAEVERLQAIEAAAREFVSRQYELSKVEVSDLLGTSDRDAYIDVMTRYAQIHRHLIALLADNPAI